MQTTRRRMALGAEPLAGGGANFRVHAPESRAVSVEIGGRSVPMTAIGEGLFEADVADVPVGATYGFRLDGGDRVLPDLASRRQPDGPHGLSALVDPDAFPWTDADWRGPDVASMVVQEIHIGTFTPEGTWLAAAERLPLLKETGIDAVEIMPANDFCGGFGWGYDGVFWFAPAHLFGTPDDLRAFVDRAHGLGIAVILDVVYNHLGPEGQYFGAYARSYFSTRYENEWGDPLNFDDDGREGMRRMVIENAAYWIREFHMDGLRFDATQQIFDASTPHVVAEAAEAARAAADGRRLFLVAENTPQDTLTLASGETPGGFASTPCGTRISSGPRGSSSPASVTPTIRTWKGPPPNWSARSGADFSTRGSGSGWRNSRAGGRRRGFRPTGSWPSSRTTTSAPTAFAATVSPGWATPPCCGR